MTERLELSRRCSIDRISASGPQMVVEADEAERARLALRLVIPELAQFRCAWRLRPGLRGVIEAEGLLTARVTQLCVVTLDAFDADVREAFNVTFVPSGLESDDDDPDAPDQLVYEGATIDLGEAAVQQLALALDPYPRKPGAELAGQASAHDGRPFDSLAPIRRGE